MVQPSVSTCCGGVGDLGGREMAKQEESHKGRQRRWHVVSVNPLPKLCFQLEWCSRYNCRKEGRNRTQKREKNNMEMKIGRIGSRPDHGSSRPEKPASASRARWKQQEIRYREGLDDVDQPTPMEQESKHDHVQQFTSSLDNLAEAKRRSARSMMRSRRKHGSQECF